MRMPDRQQLIGRVVLLSWFTIAYNLLEGLVSLYFGLTEGSIALAGFGADSFIEVFSAALVLWRFRSETAGACVSVERERRATLGIGALFVALAAATAAGAWMQLRDGSHPATTAPGLVISALSFGFMFFLWRAKSRLAAALDSATVLKDASCSLACIKLSSVLFVGSLVFLASPALWWADSAAAAALALLIGFEGVETIRAALRPDFAGGCGCA
jgi:divalent metal cation (Fe/Co/Zn/Cd) transporter